MTRGFPSSNMIPASRSKLIAHRTRAACMLKNTSTRLRNLPLKRDIKVLQFSRGKKERKTRSYRYDVVIDDNSRGRYACIEDSGSRGQSRIGITGEGAFA